MKHLLILSMIILYQIGICQELPCRNWYTKTDRNGNTINVSCKEAWSKNSNGQKHGKYILYHENENPYIVANYANGVLSGKYTEYGFDGISISLDGSYANGKQNGAWRIQNSSGSFKDGVRVGPWRHLLPQSGVLIQDHTLKTFKYSQFGNEFSGTIANGSLSGTSLFKFDVKKVASTRDGNPIFEAKVFINGFDQEYQEVDGWKGRVNLDHTFNVLSDLIISSGFSHVSLEESSFRYPLKIDKETLTDILDVFRTNYNQTTVNVSLKFNNGILAEDYVSTIYNSEGKQLDEINLLEESRFVGSKRRKKEASELAERKLIEDAQKEKELKEKPDRDTFNQVVKEGTIEGYFYYLETFPNGIYANEIRKVIKYGQARFFENTQGITTRELFERYNNGSIHKVSFVQFNDITFKIDLTQPRTIWVRDSIYQTVLDRSTKEKNLFDMILYYDAAVVDNCPEELLKKYAWVVSIVQAVEETVKENYIQSNSVLSNTSKNYLTDFLTGTNYLLLGEKKLAKDFIRTTQLEATLPNNQYLPGVYQQVGYLIDLLVQNGIPKEAFQKLASFENDKAKVSEAQVASFVK